MILLAEVLAVLLVGGAITWLVALRRPSWLTRSVDVAIVAGAGIVLATAVILLFVISYGPLDTSLGDSTRVNEAQAVGAPPGEATNTGFLAWARRKLTSGHVAPTFWLTPDTARNDPFVYQWSLYRLLPARETDALREANWLVFYNADPAKVEYDHRAFGRPIVYAPGFAVARRVDAG
jgi:hypothetical protein